MPELILDILAILATVIVVGLLVLRAAGVLGARPARHCADLRTPATPSPAAATDPEPDIPVGAPALA